MPIRYTDSIGKTRLTAVTAGSLGWWEACEACEACAGAGMLAFGVILGTSIHSNGPRCNKLAMKLMKVKVLIEVLIGLLEQRRSFFLHFFVCFVPRFSPPSSKMHTNKKHSKFSPLNHRPLQLWRYMYAIYAIFRHPSPCKLRFNPKLRCVSMFSVGTMMVQAPKHRSPLRFL